MGSKEERAPSANDRAILAPKKRQHARARSERSRTPFRAEPFGTFRGNGLTVRLGHNTVKRRCAKDSIHTAAASRLCVQIACVSDGHRDAPNAPDARNDCQQ